MRHSLYFIVPLVFLALWLASTFAAETTGLINYYNPIVVHDGTANLRIVSGNGQIILLSDNIKLKPLIVQLTNNAGEPIREGIVRLSFERGPEKVRLKPFDPGKLIDSRDEGLLVKTDDNGHAAATVSDATRPGVYYIAAVSGGQRVVFKAAAITWQTALWGILIGLVLLFLALPLFFWFIAKKNELIIELEIQGEGAVLSDNRFYLVKADEEPLILTSNNKGKIVRKDLAEGQYTLTPLPRPFYKPVKPAFPYRFKFETLHTKEKLAVVLTFDAVAALRANAREVKPNSLPVQETKSA